MTTATERFARTDLDLGKKLGSGAQGSLYVVENADALPGPAFPFPVIYKEFHPKTQVSGPALDVLAQFRLALDDHDRKVIDAMTVWPCAVVDDGSGRASGYLMQRIPSRFLQTIETTSGKEQIAREIQQLFVPEAIARKNLGETANRVERMALVRDLAFAMGFLHKRDFVYGDMSYKNAVFCLRPHPGVMLLDCDAIRKLGQSAAVPQLHSPGWKPPEGGPQTKGTDRYKLGLAVLRCLTPGVNAQNRDPAKAAGVLDSEGMSLLRRALGENAEKRTTGKEWVQYFNRAIERAGGVRQRAGAAPAPKPNPVRRAPPSPRPVVAIRSQRAALFGPQAPAFTRSRGGALQPARTGTTSSWTTGSLGARNAFGSPAGAPAQWSSTSAPVGSGFQAAIVGVLIVSAIIIVGVIAANFGTQSSTKFSITTTTSRNTRSTSPPSSADQTAKRFSNTAKATIVKASSAAGSPPLAVSSIKTRGRLSATPTWDVTFVDLNTGAGKGLPLAEKTYFGSTEVVASTERPTAFANVLIGGWERGLEAAMSQVAQDKIYSAGEVEVSWACDESNSNGDCRWRFEVIPAATGSQWFTFAGVRTSKPPWGS